MKTRKALEEELEALQDSYSEGFKSNSIETNLRKASRINYISEQLVKVYILKDEKEEGC